MSVGLIGEERIQVKDGNTIVLNIFKYLKGLDSETFDLVTTKFLESGEIPDEFRDNLSGFDDDEIKDDILKILSKESRLDERITPLCVVGNESPSKVFSGIISHILSEK